jgi:subtilisin family serine protease
MDPLAVARLAPLMAETEGRSDLAIGLIDGPVASAHPGLADARLHHADGAHCAGTASLGTASLGTASPGTASLACRHGTFVAGMLVARRDSDTAGLCPGCTLLVRPIFHDAAATRGHLPSATPEALAQAILDCVRAGARLINLSAALHRPALGDAPVLRQALDHAAAQGIIVVAAAGNLAMLGGSAITAHPWVIPVVACDQAGQPLAQGTLGGAIGRQGLTAPGDRIAGLDAAGGTMQLSGTSAAAPFVTGAIALLWSAFPDASAARVRGAVAGRAPRRSVVPPLLDGAAALRALRP